MAHIAEEGGLRLFLTRDSMGHCVGSEDRYRFTDAFADGLDFAHAEFRQGDSTATGRRIPRAAVLVSAGTSP